MRTGEMNPLDALHVATHMRDWDRKEIFATRWNDDVNDLAEDCCMVGSFAWVVYGETEPVALVGAHPVHPGVWGVWMFATDNFHQVSISLTKFVKRVMIPALVKAGAHRAECKSMEGHEEAHKWLEFLGAKRESTLKEFGKDGQDFHTYVWRREDVRI